MTTTKELKEIEMITSIRLEQYTITGTWINVKYFVFHYVQRRPLEMPKNDGAVFWEWKNKQVSRKSAWIIRMSAELRLLIQEKRAIDRQNRNWNTDLLWTKRERAEKKHDKTITRSYQLGLNGIRMLLVCFDHHSFEIMLTIPNLFYFSC